MAQENPYAKYVTGGSAPTPPASIPGTPRPKEPSESKLPQGYERGPDGNARPIPGLPSAFTQPDKTTARLMTPEEVKAAGLPPGGVYQIDSNNKITTVSEAPKGSNPQTEEQRKGAIAELVRVIDVIDTVAIDAADNGGWFETGFTGSLTREIPGTAGYDLGQNVKTIQANTAFDRLQKMRQDSPTGGALGNVTEKELELLKSTVANVDPNQSPEAFFANLAATKRAYLDRLKTLDPQLADSYALKKGIRWDGENGPAILVTYDGPLQTDERANPLGINTGGGGTPPAGGAPPSGNQPGFGEQMWDSFKAGTGDLIEGGINSTVGLFLNPLATAGFRGMGYKGYNYDAGKLVRKGVLGLPDNPNRTASAINQSAAGAMAFGGGGALTAAKLGPGVARNALLQVGANPVGDAAIGAVAAGSGEAARAAGAGPVGQTVASLAGGFGTAGALSRMGRVPRPAVPGPTPPTDPRAVIEAGKREGVKVMTSDVLPPTSMPGKTARLIGENIPFAGTSGKMGGRASQQEQRVAATERLVQELGGTPATLDDVTRDFVANRSRQLSALTKAKDSAIDGVQTPVMAPNAIRAIDQEIGRLNSANPQAFAPVISKLENFKQVLGSGKSLREIEVNRRLLGDMFEDPGLANVKGEGQKSLNAIYAPLRDDMGNAIEANLGRGERAKWEAANKKLSGMVGELGDAKFRRVLNRSDSDPEEVAKLLFSRQPGDVRRLFGNLSEAGKTKGRSALIYKVAQDATEGDTINPDKFRKGIAAIDSATGVFFPPAEKARIDGFVRLMETTGRAGALSSEVATGARNTGLAVGVGGTTLAGPKVIPVALSYGLMARLYESGVTRDLLLKLGRSKPGSPAEAAIGKRLSDYIVRAGITQAPANDMGQALSRSTTAAYAEDQKQN